MFPQTITGSRLILKKMNEQLMRPYLVAFSERVRLYVHVSSVFEEECYLKDRIEKGSIFFYALFHKKTHQIIGALEIRDDQKLRGQLYCWLNEHFWGNGYLNEALELAAPMYFSCTHNTFFTAHVDAHNERSYKSLKRFGFADGGLINGPYGLQYELILRRKD